MEKYLFCTTWINIDTGQICGHRISKGNFNTIKASIKNSLYSNDVDFNVNFTEDSLLNESTFCFDGMYNQKVIVIICKKQRI